MRGAVAPVFVLLVALPAHAQTFLSPAIGPTVERGFVDHARYEFLSIPKAIEERFGLPPLNEEDMGAVAMRSFLR